MSIDQLTPGTWNVDASHSTIGFSARHLMLSKVRGRFATFEGSITVGDDPLASKVAATVDIASVTTGDAARDGHLLGEDFFDVANFPSMGLSTTAVRSVGDDYVLDGDLTIKGVTKPVSFALQFEGVAADPWGGTRAAFSAETEINRKDWGLSWNVALETGGVLVGEKVKIQLDIQAVRV